MLLDSNATLARAGCRRGTIACLVALTMIILVAFLGLAIDLGMMAMAKTQSVINP